MPSEKLPDTKLVDGLQAQDPPQVILTECEENDPAGQRAQEEAPVVLPYLPASHLEHVVELMEAENAPSSHGMQGPSTVDDVFLCVPSDAFVIAHVTVEVLRVPGRQVAHVEAPEWLA